MRAKVLNEFAGARKYALTFDGHDEIISGLAEFARENRVRDASFSGLGTLSGAVLAWFDQPDRQFAPISIEGAVELLMLNGRISSKDDRTDISAHVVIGTSDGTARGGHLLRAKARANTHLFVEELRPRIQATHH
jgi:hypothetical protein